MSTPRTAEVAGEVSGAAAERAGGDALMLRRAAMDWLARREHSAEELRRKLQRKYADAMPQLITAVIEQLQLDGLQSDERFTESRVRYRRNRGFGYRHILQDLKRRGIPSTVADRYLHPDDEHWLAAASHLVSKRLAANQLIESGSSLHHKLIRYLRSRGFEPQQIQYALQPHLSHQ